MKTRETLLTSDLTSLYAWEWPASHEVVRQRIYILYYWQKHGLRKTREHFGVSQRTLYRWKAKLRQTPGKRVQGLTPKSTTPKSKRQGFEWPVEVIDRIYHLKQTQPYLGKSRIHTQLMQFCNRYYLPCPSESTIGRLLAEMPDGRHSRSNYIWRHFNNLHGQPLFMSYHHLWRAVS